MPRAGGASSNRHVRDQAETRAILDRPLPLAATSKATRSAAMTDKMLSRKEGGVGFVIFNNPERHNAVSLEMWEATKHILDGFAADKDVRVVVLTGAGGKAFVSGADISKFDSERATLEAQRAYSVRSEAAYGSIYDFPKP